MVASACFGSSGLLVGWLLIHLGFARTDLSPRYVKNGIEEAAAGLLRCHAAFSHEAKHQQEGPRPKVGLRRCAWVDHRGPLLGFDATTPVHTVLQHTVGLGILSLLTSWGWGVVVGLAWMCVVSHHGICRMIS
jgi:hypothetical protein